MAEEYGHGENNFSDDDLDDLPLNALAELENNAIQFTQAANTQVRLKAAPSSDYGDDFDGEDLDDTIVIDESRSTPAIIPALGRSNPGPATQREQFQPQQYGNNTGLANRRRANVPLYQPSRDRIARPVSPLRNSGLVARPGSQSVGVDDPEALRKELEELRKRNQALEQNINAKAGEVAIVRSKQEKEAREHERELNALRKLNEEKLAKQRKELEAARIAAENAVTERDFVKQDLAESERVRRLNRAAERKDSIITPKKKKTLPHRDGFDDDEIEILSPSKISPSNFRGRNGTPTKPGKRKRKAVESPAAALEVIQADEHPIEHPEFKVPIFDEAIGRLGIQDDRFDFLGTMLDHRPNKDHLRTIEALGNYALPSAPKESFESIILGKIPALGLKKPISDLPIEFCELLISQWSKCMDEKYLKPIYLFIDMLTIALELKTTSVAPHIVDTLVPLAQLTADLVAIPRYKEGSLEGHDEFIDVSSCMKLLHLTALGCMSEIEHITRFWRLFRLDFILLMLSPNQPTEDSDVMIKLLSTSVLPASFGMVIVDDEKKLKQATEYILDRLSHPLFEIPHQSVKKDQQMDPHTVLKVRLGILQLMTSMTRSPFASQALATHRFTIGMLVSLMSDELDVLYDWKAGNSSSAVIVTLATRLLYHLVTKHDNIINMQQKLAQIPGGNQKYLLVLARLNFSEDDLVLESGIAPDIPGLALEMLEGAVTPEEGDSILGAFVAA